jgi:hypothetical protein
MCDSIPRVPAAGFVLREALTDRLLDVLVMTDELRVALRGHEDDSLLWIAAYVERVYADIDAAVRRIAA